jgi:large subunit ribosomal protein L24
MKQKQNWSNDWNSSTNPGKQRKYRRNAPNHVKDKLVSANLDPELREELETRTIKLAVGDRVELMRGDDKGKEGIVKRIDRDEQKVYVSNITVERQNGTETEKPLRPSNLQVKALNIDNETRLDKYEVEDVAAVKVSEQEVEEALEEDEENEMMQKMQAGQGQEDVSTEEEEDEETSEAEEEAEEAETEGTNYDDLVEENIGDVKNALSEMDDPDYKAVLEAEKSNKNRTTLVDWLESKVE